MSLITAIHQIEITSRCNLKCVYCPSYRLPRPKVDMPWDVFEQSLSWAKYFYDRHGHNELNLAGIGESTLHPHFAEYMLRARKVMGWSVDLILATNGLLITEELVDAIAPAKPKIWVSLHRPEKCVNAVQILQKAGLLVTVSSDGALQSIDWAGQVDYPVTTAAKGSPCPWHRNGWSIVLADGRVSRCCLDSTGEGTICYITDDLSQYKTSKWKLCDTCHLT